ncbi:aminotransferase class I/II-fold pyridoxal phosphate-dependent enzyme [Psittacicella gerlachiana]|uniref:Aminotransferase class I/classII large domain-containing protein n=1 Tax=Psittacicella gerlachiana TaxID=2028574 RepID=A0A3A1YK34_9GAMM|nr:pyridoxal phosphate-dependent aminotransferase family protein [Psittacicella gerlachiana]RIY37816.1 hypothetical protein CKF59_01450 [Psittacicella gerlachiana]
MESITKQALNAINTLKEKNNYRYLGKYSQKDSYPLDLSSNDYLNLANTSWEQVASRVFTDSNNGRVNYSSLSQIVLNFLKERQAYPLPRGATGSRLLSGDNYWVEAIEKDLSQLLAPYNKDCLFYNSGYHANMGILPPLVKLHPQSSIVIMDKLVHASLIDGVILAGVKFKRFAHNDITDLKIKVKQAVESGYTNIFLALESIYSMDGDNLSKEQVLEIIQLKKEYEEVANIIIYVDEAHAVGLFGQFSLGMIDSYGLLKDIDIIVCPLGKAINSSGALVLTNKTIREYLINTSRSLIYSTSLGVETIVATATNLIYANHNDTQQEANRLLNLTNEFRLFLKEKIKARLTKNQEYLAEEMVGGDNQIVSFIVGSNTAVIDLANYLSEHGILVGAIKSPTVPKNFERLRICFNTTLLQEQSKLTLLKETFSSYTSSDDFLKILTQKL